MRDGTMDYIIGLVILKWNTHYLYCPAVGSGIGLYEAYNPARFARQDYRDEYLPLHDVCDVCSSIVGLAFNVSAILAVQTISCVIATSRLSTLEQNVP